nr:Ku protein [Longispora albida]
MRAIWKGAVSFGLVSIGVQLYSATEEKDLKFHQVHREDGGRIRYKRVCEVCAKEVGYSDIVKGYDLGGGDLVLLDEDDFKGLPLSSSRAVEVLEFVPAEQIDPILYNKAYYLEPAEAAVRPYVLLRDALAGGGKVAIVKVALRQREALATLRVHENVLVLNTMLWPDEIRKPKFGFLDDDVKVRPQELKMAESLIETMTGDFEPSDYHDDYRKALQEVVDAKIAGREVVAPEAPVMAEGKVIDLMAALKASVEQAKSPAAAEKKPARKATPAKKAPAKKAAAKRALKAVPAPAKRARKSA